MLQMLRKFEYITFLLLWLLSMQFLVQPVRQRRLHSMILLRILEQLNVGFLILRIGFHGGIIKDSGEDTAMIHLLIVSLCSFLYFLIFLHTVVQIQPCDRSLKSEVPCGSCLNWR